MTTHGSGTGGYERRDVNLVKVGGFSLLTIVAIIAVLVFVTDYFYVTTEQIIEEVVLSPPSRELRELRARETEELSTYKLLDAEAGLYRIPIERAMYLEAEEAFAQAEATR